MLHCSIGQHMMSDRGYDMKLSELDRLLNDPDSKMEPARIWSLLAEISKQAENGVSEQPPQR